MTDYISRLSAIHGITEAFDEVLSVADAIEILEKLPAADVVPKDFHERCLQIEIQKRMALEKADVREVVLCKDCYAYRKDKELAEASYLDGEKYCALIRCEMPEDGFCWYGKRICGADMMEEQT